MLKIFFPGSFVDSIYDIDLSLLKAKGIKGFILDLDNTLVARNSSTATDDLKDWLNTVSGEGFKACILSNNWKQRVSSIAVQVDLPLVARAAKPRKKAFIRALEALGTCREETVVVGDQIFTDILGGNLAGLRTILVAPMSDHEAFHTKFVLRHLERLVMKRWQHNPWAEK